VRDEPRVATFDADVDEPELVGHASAAPAATESELTPAAVAAGEVGGAPSALDAEPEFAAGLEEEVREEELTLAGPPPVAPSADNLISDGVEPISARPPQPSWEQPGLFDEEPVDAYGTPLSLVDALRKANEDTAERLGEPVEPAPEPEPEVAATAQNGLFDEPAAAPAPAVAEDDTADDDQSEEDDEDDEPAGSDELDAEDDLDALAEDDDAPLASKPAAEEPLPAVVLQPRAAPAPEPHPEPAALAEDDAPEAVEEPETVRHVVSEGSSSEDVVYRAGCLFLERGRVAVSMLQREFGLDFKAATEVLDELQKAGLIGPYLGGQRRDILLTREQWDQRVGAA
jgi:hypothetical protein